MKKAGSHFLLLLCLFFVCFNVHSKSGIGSCIALKAGLARHPAMGKCGAGSLGLMKLWISG
jgi:hypothetical protein